MSEKKGLIEISQNELSKVENNALNASQLNFLLSKTPSNHIYERPAKGGGKWKFVTGVYVKKVLNLMFGWDWSFEVVEHKFDLTLKQAYVLGKLTVNSNGKTIVKMQFGRVDIKLKKNSDPETGVRMPLDIGNDLKAATTDALKKCASELGIASDVYSPNEFKAIKVVENVHPLEELKSFYKNNEFSISEDDLINIERIIDQEEELSYDKAMEFLKSKVVKDGK